jgi:hypothetical protein
MHHPIAELVAEKASALLDRQGMKTQITQEDQALADRFRF